MACIQSASKWEFMMRLGLDHNNADHQALYWLMKSEAIRAYDTMLKDNRNALKADQRNATTPFAANHFTDAAMNTAIASIEANATAQTSPLYARGRFSRPNWVIRWMLYHVCRYRDARNRSAQSKKFHDDDHLDPPAGASNSRSTGQYYDAARNGYRQAQTSA
ncbi:hypothetical protein MMC21_006409 [Puttea exsequens]|nr:hypothetical protein [Puttea exsequens]